MWERIKLSSNYTKALEQIDSELVHWPNFTIHKCKQRVTRIAQYLIKMRRLKLRQDPKLIGVKKKQDRREAVRERKALAAAHLEKSIEKELLGRLKSKAYGDAPLNVNEHVWQAILDKGSVTIEQEGDAPEINMLDEETDEDMIGFDEDGGEREYVSDLSEDQGDILSDVEDVVSDAGHDKPDEEGRVEVEYEQELEVAPWVTTRY